MDTITLSQTTQPLKTITKALFVQTATKYNLNYHGSCFVKQEDKFKTLNHIHDNIDTCNILGHRQLVNKTLTSLKFASTKGYSYLDISGKSCYINMTYTHVYKAVFIVINDISESDQTSIVVYSLDK